MRRNVIVSLAVAVLLIATAVWVRNRQETPIENQEVTPPIPTITAEQLKAADGKNDALCWIAVEGTVYEIEQGSNWIEGEHTESQGQAYCGFDLSDTIDRAPHGRTKLTQLKEIGTLQ